MSSVIFIRSAVQGGIRRRYLLEHQIVWIEIDINGILPESISKDENQCVN